MDLLKQFDEFVRNLTRDDVIGVIFHADPDGICSAVISAIAIERLLKKKIALFHTQGHTQIAVESDLVKYLRDKGVTKAIFVDLAIDQKPENFYELEQYMDCLVIDHHKLYYNLNSEETVHIKPQMIDSEAEGSKYCASKMCYDFFSRVVNISDIDWIALIGVIGDFTHEAWHKFVDQVCRKYRVDCSDVLTSKFGRATWVIDAGESVVPNRTGESLKLLYTARNVDEILNSPLAELAKEVRKEVDSIVYNHEEFSERKGDIILMELKSKYKIKSEVANMLSVQHKNMSVFIYTTSPRKDYVHISGRRQDYQVDIADALEQAIKGLKGASGGGHKPAAAATVRSEDFPEFKKRLFEILLK